MEADERRGLIAEFRVAAEAVSSHRELASVALRLSRIEQTRLRLGEAEAALDGLREGARRAAADADCVAAKRIALDGYLFATQGFRGARGAEFGPDTALLDRIVDARVGIPIGLSTIYMTCAEGVGLKTHGIGFPGHFLVGCLDEWRETTVVDPFYRGRTLGSETLVGQLAEQGFPAQSLDFHLRPSSYPEILIRMLRNLTGMYRRAGNFAALLVALEHLLALDPGNGRYLRERGIVHDQLGAHDAARRDYEDFLEISPDDAEASSVMEQLRRLPRGTRLTH